jgi:DNA-binding CsgD family transcriptional regulator
MSKRISAEKTSHIIGLIYDCAIVPQNWKATLDTICTELSFLHALLNLYRLPAGVPISRHRWSSAGLSEYWIDRQQQYGPEMIDYWGGMEMLLNFPLDEPQVASHSRGTGLRSANRFIDEWLAPQSICDLVGCALKRDPNSLASIVFARHQEAGTVTDNEVASLRLLGPHFRRAVEISNLLDAKIIEAATLTSTFEGLAAGIVLVDAEARLIHANAAARSMLEAADPIRIDHGRLNLPTSQASNALTDAIARSGGDLQQMGQRGISIPGQMKDGRPSVAHVLPIKSGHIMRSKLEQRAIAAVFIAPVENAPQMPAAALALLYDMTPAETRVLELIAEGRTLLDVAVKLGISRNTAKTHLQHVFAKTRTKRQTELIRLLASLKLPV